MDFVKYNEDDAIKLLYANPDNREMHLAAARKYGWVFKQYRDDREMHIASFNGYTPIYNLPEYMYKDKDLMTIAIKSGASLGYLNDKDRSIVLSNFSQNEIIDLLRNNGALLQYFSDLQDDEVVVRAAMMSRRSTLKYASDRLKSNSDLLFTAVSTDCWAYECLANMADIRATQEAVRRGGYNLQYVPEDKKNARYSNDCCKSIWMDFMLCAGILR